MSLKENKVLGGRFMCAIAVIIVLSLGAVTFKRNDIWRLDLSLWYHVIMNSPEKARPYASMGIAYAGLGIFDEATKNAEKAVRIKPRDVVFRTNLGIIYAVGGRVEEAIAEFKYILDMSIKYSTAYSAFGRLLGMEGRRDEAIVYLNKAIRLDKNNIEAYNVLGNVYLEDGKPDKAIETYLEGLRYGKTHNLMRYNLAVVYMKEGLWAASAREFRTLMDNDPSYENAKSGLTLVLKKSSGEQ